MRAQALSRRFPTAYSTCSNASKGFSLVELMIALVLGLILIIGMVSVFASNSISSRLNQAMATMQENARFSLETISRDIRMAGFQGCSPIVNGSVNIKAIDAPVDNPDQGLSSSFIWISKVESASSWDPAPPWGVDFDLPDSPSAVPGTDVVAVQFGDSQTYRLNAQVGVSTADPAGDIQLSVDPAALNIDTGDLAIIADCFDGDLFEVTGVTAGADTVALKHAASSTSNDSASLQAAYGNSDDLLSQTMVMRFNAHIFYVGDTGFDNSNGNDINALYLQTYPFDSSNPPVELIQGVDHLAATLTVMDDSEVLRQVNAGDAMPDPTTVQSISLGILMASDEQVAHQDDTNSYRVASTFIGPATTDDIAHDGDKRLRLAFNTTIKIRNVRELSF